MPLSEEEQRILQEIEDQLVASDSGLADELSGPDADSHSVRMLKWSFMGFVVGVVILIATLQITFLLSFLGFLTMLGSAIIFERNARALGRSSVDRITRNILSNSRNVDRDGVDRDGDDNIDLV